MKLLRGFSREQLVSLLVALSVVVLSLPAVIALWPHQAITGLPNGTSVTYEGAQLSNVDLADCVNWVEAESLCGEATATFDDGSTQLIGVAKDGWASGLGDGDRVIVTISTTEDGTSTTYSFHSVERSTPMLILAIIVIGLVALSVGRKGLRAFASLVLSALFIWTFLITGIHLGGNPVVYAGLTSILVLTVVLHFTHGFSAKTLAAWMGTVCGVGSALLAGWAFASVLRLSGVDETTSAAVFTMGGIDVRLLSLAALLIALIGILNDITVAQASTVISLSQRQSPREDDDPAGRAMPPGPEAGIQTLSRREHRMLAQRSKKTGWQLPWSRGNGVARQAMHVGKDHAASAIYTVTFSVVGASLASFVVARSYGMPMWALLQSETVAGTIAQLLAGFVGLAITMPATTFFAALFVRLLNPGPAQPHGH